MVPGVEHSSSNSGYSDFGGLGGTDCSQGWCSCHCPESYREPDKSILAGTSRLLHSNVGLSIRI